jgi:uncharacterized protein
MAVDHIRYDILAQEALRGVVRTVLGDTAKNGLPGEHHFYITFDTRADGVRMPPRLMSQFPDAMTIVLQHQFWDLVVGESAFEVGMSFGGIPERLTVPFAAIKEFVDPAVPFGFKFEPQPEAAAAADAPAGADRPEAEPKEAYQQEYQRGAEQEPVQEPKHTRTTPAIAAVPTSASQPTETPPDDGPSAGGGEVVRLDRFRKK